MKKIFLILFCALILTWCTSNSSNPQPAISAPHITVNIITWRVLVDTPDTILPGEYWFVIDKETWFKFSYITGYSYSYTYPDLWYTITTSWWYGTSSYILFTWSLLTRSGTLVYNTQLPIWADYLQTFTKNPTTTLAEEIYQHHFSKTCLLSTWILNETTAYFPSMSGFDIVYLEDIWSSHCVSDLEFSERIMPVIFIMNPKKPHMYYKVALNNWCAPGPCSIFGDISFF